MQPSALHSIITSQSGWLNTSRPLTPDDLKGRILLLDFWTFCCINCMHVIPDLHYLEETFGNDLTVIGVHSAKFENERDTENIRSAMLRYDIEHPVVNDFDFSIWKKFGVRAWPTFVLINPRGAIENVYSGEGNREAAARDIEHLRQKYAGELNTSPLPIALEKDKMPEGILKFPGKLAFGDDTLFVSDSGHERIALMTKEGRVTGSIGSGKTGFKDGSFAEAKFNSPQGVLYKDGRLYIADTGNHALRMADLKTQTVTTLAGTGKQGYERSVQNAPALKTPLASPWDLAFYPDDMHIAIAMAGTHQLWTYDIAQQTVSVLAGNGRESIDDGAYPYNSLSQPSGLSVVGNKLYFVDSETSSLRVLENGKITTLIGSGLFDFGFADGVKGEALMQHAIGVYGDEKSIYIADSYNHSIRRYDPVKAKLHTYAGFGERGSNNGQPLQSSFNEPNDVLVIGNVVYVADTNNHAIRTIDMTTGKVSTLHVSGENPKTPTASAPATADTLPNLANAGPFMVVPEKPATLRMGLQKGWHINEDAPSELVLFDMNGAPKEITRFGLAELRKDGTSLPALKLGNYKLQGTLYYCEDKEGALCLIKSFDARVAAAPAGGSDILLPLN